MQQPNITPWNKRHVAVATAAHSIQNAATVTRWSVTII